VALVADARIDNVAELLALLGSECRQPADADLIRVAYRHWGERLPEMLVGDYAFAIWDTSRRTLFCARDHAGPRPFYYHHSQRHSFAFGSSIAVLACLASVPVRLEEAKVADYFFGSHADPAMSWWRDVSRLPPAHCMSLSPHGLRLWRYWRLDPDREIRLRGGDAYTEALREQLTIAVRCRIQADNPVGVLLSGGIDSPSLAATPGRIL